MDGFSKKKSDGTLKNDVRRLCRQVLARVTPELIGRQVSVDFGRFKQAIEEFQKIVDEMREKMEDITLDSHKLAAAITTSLIENQPLYIKTDGEQKRANLQNICFALDIGTEIIYKYQLDSLGIANQLTEIEKDNLKRHCINIEENWPFPNEVSNDGVRVGASFAIALLFALFDEATSDVKIILSKDNKKGKVTDEIAWLLAMDYYYVDKFSRELLETSKDRLFPEMVS